MTSEYPEPMPRLVRMPNGVRDYLERGTTPAELAEAETAAAAGAPDSCERALARQEERRRQPPAVRYRGTPILTAIFRALTENETDQ